MTSKSKTSGFNFDDGESGGSHSSGEEAPKTKKPNFRVPSLNLDGAPEAKAEETLIDTMP